MDFPPWMSTALIVVLIIIGLVWIYKRGQSATSSFDRACALINGLAEDSRSDSQKSVDAGEALEFVKGYVRALDDNLLISEAESAAIRSELKRWPETRIAE